MYVSVCTFSDTVNGACYPHINLSIPAVTVWPTVEEYIENDDVNILRRLTTNDPLVLQLWKLELGKCLMSCSN